MKASSVGLIDELIEEYDVALDTEFLHARHKALAVGLALIPDEIGVRRAQNDIDRIGTALQDRRHRVDHDFDALVGRKQAEGQDDGPAAEAEPGLGLRRARRTQSRECRAV